MTEPATGPRIRWGWIILAIVVGSGAFVLLLPAINARQRRGVVHHIHGHHIDMLKNLGLSLRNYRAALGSFPPAYTVNKDGHRMHSWRTLLLPYLDGRSREVQMNLEIPWHHPENRRATLEQFDDYLCLCSRSASEAPLTNYVVVTGPGFVFDGAKATRLEDITDDPSQTILIIECLAYPIYWAEPRDLTFEELYAALEAGPIDNRHAEFRFMTADGVARRLTWDRNQSLPSRELLHAMFTIAGGEDVEKMARSE